MHKLNYSDGNYIHEMSGKHKLAITINDGDSITVETIDCFKGRLFKDNQQVEIYGKTINPATGPIYINGAEPGDVLAVTINDIEIAETGIMVASSLYGTFKDELSNETASLVQIDNNYVYLADNLKIKLHKMIGVIGTAPKGQEEIFCGLPDYHGGNMDTKEITQGATVYLPVHHKGGLLSLGDLHAAMGDGETAGTGIEVSGQVNLTVNVKKQSNLPTPAIAYNDELYFLYSDTDLNIASKQASLHAFKFLSEILGVEKHLSARICSAICDLGISQIVNNKKTAKMSIPMDIIKQLNKDYKNIL